MHRLTPTDAIKIFQHIAALDWQPLNANDRANFADAGPDARLAWISQSRSADFAELFDIRPDLDCETPLMAIIGGDHLTLEIHGIEADGTPIALSYDLVPNEH